MLTIAGGILLAIFVGIPLTIIAIGIIVRLLPVILFFGGAGLIAALVGGIK